MTWKPCPYCGSKWASDDELDDHRAYCSRIGPEGRFSNE